MAPFDITKLDLLEPGVSTTADAIQLFGKPYSESTFANKSTLLQWIYNSGGSGAHAAVLFDAAGKMIRVQIKTVTGAQNAPR